MGELRDAGVRVAVVDMPYPSEAIERRDTLFGDQYQRVSGYFRSSGPRLGYTYLHYGDGTLAAAENFYDCLHLNGRGATSFTRLLAEDVIAHELAPSRVRPAAPSL